MTGTPTGVLPVLATPFTADGAVDLPSLERLVDALVESGVDGVVCFGLASETYKLDDKDRELILETVLSAGAGRVPVIVGTEHSGTTAAVRRATSAANAGASAVMAFPPTFVTPNDSDIEHYYEALADAVGVPVIIQDAPAWTRVNLPTSLLVRLHRLHANLCAVKLESPPIAEKAAALRSEGIDVISGFGAAHFMEDLDAEPVAIMPGCAIPSFFAYVWRVRDADRAGEVLRLVSARIHRPGFCVGVEFASGGGSAGGREVAAGLSGSSTVLGAVAPGGGWVVRW